MSVVAVNAMTRAVLAPKAAGAKPRASAFVGRPAALKARVAGTRASPHEPTLARNLDLVSRKFLLSEKNEKTRFDFCPILLKLFLYLKGCAIFLRNLFFLIANFDYLCRR